LTSEEVEERRFAEQQKAIKSDTGADALKYKSRLVAKGYTQTYVKKSFGG
jgi:hypothetical protein